ncbi:hypothetical protein MTR67_014374 [Solanum verrucosum]|uniref:Uncharacterized protein n=1 Tax=Solanum verrucosum TaxID=315347 RepID=A0AAF0QJD5_SOLVR|nr:hypothetical protein MTR67_014374 [Solanum verrucosum]
MKIFVGEIVSEKFSVLIHKFDGGYYGEEKQAVEDYVKKGIFSWPAEIADMRDSSPARTEPTTIVAKSLAFEPGASLFAPFTPISGKQRSQQNWANLFSDAGFKIIPIPGLRSIIEVYP